MPGISPWKNLPIWFNSWRLQVSLGKKFKYWITYLKSMPRIISAWCTDFRNVFFEKNQWTPFKVFEVKRVFSRSLRPNFGFHLVSTSFHLEFSSFWVSRLFDLGNLSNLRNGTRKYFENSLKSMHLFQWLMGAMNCR